MKFNQTPSTLQQIPDGPEGIYITLRHMRRFIRDGKIKPVIREKAMQLTSHLHPKDWVGEVQAIHKFVRDDIRYIKDITNVETVAWPEYTLEKRAGDCDDKVVLAGALLESIGHPTRSVAIGFIPGVYCHVLLETKIGAKWVTVETTEPVEVGWQPKNTLAKPMVIYN